jgi:hypothetical protein
MDINHHQSMNDFHCGMVQLLQPQDLEGILQCRNAVTALVAKVAKGGWG